MIWVPYIGAAVVALLAIAFVAWPAMRAVQSRKARLLLGGAVTLFVLGIGGGIYTLVGEPYLALREAQGPRADDINGLAPALIARVRKSPNDVQAWVYLAEIYTGARDAQSAAAALGHAVTAARQMKRETPILDTTYGEMLIRAEGGQVPPQAEAVFQVALKTEPRNIAARYYLGMASAQKGDRVGAQRYWQSLLDDIPAASPLHGRLVDMLAGLGTATPNVQGAGGAPDISAMVAGLAARLKANPNDPAGWQRLIRAYSVLGETDKAKAALASARASASSDPAAKAALDGEAKQLKLE